jgi:hypothetical protein
LREHDIFLSFLEEDKINCSEVEMKYRLQYKWKVEKLGKIHSAHDIYLYYLFIYLFIGNMLEDLRFESSYFLARNVLAPATLCDKTL